MVLSALYCILIVFTYICINKNLYNISYIFLKEWFLLKNVTFYPFMKDLKKLKKI